jgi:putative ABC transport system permease protein
MSPEDTLRFGLRAITGARGRTWLMLIAMAISVGSVVVLTALGEGARSYVMGEFSSLGTHLLIVLPGRSETTGGHPPIMGETPRDLTIEDATALYRSHAVRRVAPISVGSAPVSYGAREREVSVIGTTAEMLEVRELTLAQGSFLPPGDPSRGSAVCVLGAELKRELFGTRRALGEWVRIGDRRFRVIGILAHKGQSLGVDIADTAMIPVASAQAVFNTYGLFRVLVQAKTREAIPRAKQAVVDILRERHDGEEDVTVLTQDAVLATFDRILTTLTLAVGGIAAISLAVAGILIMNVMLVSVSQRTSEIGLLKAIGASRGQIMRLFLTESAMLSLLGAATGMAVAYAGIWVLQQFFPSFPFEVPMWSLGAAVLMALITGLVFGVLPARRAARLDPVEALARR